MSVQAIDYAAIAPPLLLAMAALAVLGVDAFVPRRAFVGYTALAGVLAALVATALLAAGNEPRQTFCLPVGGPPACSYVVDEFTVLVQLVMLVAAVVVLLVALAEVRATALPAGEFYFLLLAALTGAVALPAARDLVTLVVCLEVVSLPVFALAALRRYDGRSSEAGLTMFLVSVVSTAVMLFGISLVYGTTGTLHLGRIAAALTASPPAIQHVAAVGVVLVLVGFGFKVSAVPFHFWAPDTYQGSPIAVAAFLSVVSKMAGFAGLVLVLAVGFAPYAHVWGPLLAALAAVTMTAGNLVALRQRSAVRLLAWSSIAQAGYILAPLGAAAAVGGEAQRDLVAASIGYLAIYAVMNIGAFAVVSSVGRDAAPARAAMADTGVPTAVVAAGGDGAAGMPGAAGGLGAAGASTVVGAVGAANATDLDGYRGLARANPLVSVALAFFLACLAGLPPGLAGLFAKIVVFRATVSAGYGWLAVLMAVNTVIGLYYYLSWASRLFTPSPAVGVRAAVPLPVAVAIGVAAAGTVLLSVVPQLVLGIAPG